MFPSTAASCGPAGMSRPLLAAPTPLHPLLLFHSQLRVQSEPEGEEGQEKKSKNA